MAEWSWPQSKVVRVVDGDTFVAEVTRDLGFNGKATFTQRMRLGGINCPPLHGEGGAAAAKAAEELMMGHPVDIVTTGPYKFGDEWMAQVTLATGSDVGYELIRSGHAHRWDGRGPRPGG